VAFLGTAASVLMPPAFFPPAPAASLNLGYVFCASGAFLTPFVADLLLRRLVYGRVLTLLAIVALLPAVMCAFTRQDAFPAPGDEGPASVLANPTLWLIGLAFWLYSPLESSLSTWATPYLE